MIRRTRTVLRLRLDSQRMRRVGRMTTDDPRGPAAPVVIRWEFRPRPGHIGSSAGSSKTIIRYKRVVARLSSASRTPQPERGSALHERRSFFASRKLITVLNEVNRN